MFLLGKLGGYIKMTKKIKKEIYSSKIHLIFFMWVLAHLLVD